MTYSDTEPRGTLRYRLLSSSILSTPSDHGSWGHEYIQHLAVELSLDSEFVSGQEGEGIEELHELGVVCTKFLLIMWSQTRQTF